MFVLRVTGLDAAEAVLKSREAMLRVMRAEQIEVLISREPPDEFLTVSAKWVVTTCHYLSSGFSLAPAEHIPYGNERTNILRSASIQPGKERPGV